MREGAEQRARIDHLERANAQLAAAAGELQRELDLLGERHAAQSGVVAMLRADLAAGQARIARLHATKADLAKNAQAALRDVEKQVEVLASAVDSLRAEKDQAAAAAAAAAAVGAAAAAATGDAGGGGPGGRRVAS